MLDAEAAFDPGLAAHLMGWGAALAVLAALSAGLPFDWRGHVGVIAGLVAVVHAVGGGGVPVGPRAVVDAYLGGLATPDREGIVARIDAEDRVGAWTELARAHPSQPWLTWRRALALADAGDIAHGQRVLENGSAWWPRNALAVGMPALSFVSGDAPLQWSARGFVLYTHGGLRSRPLLPGESLALDADLADGEGPLAQVTWVPDCGAGAVDVRVAGPVRYALIPPCAEAARGGWPVPAQGPMRIEVRFTNDASGSSGDRNLYAMVVDGPGDPLPPWSWRGFAEAAFPDGTWVEGRGFQLAVDGALRSGLLEAPVVLRLDADAPGGEPALAQVLWEPACGTLPVEVAVRGPLEVPLAPGCPSSLVVAFTNDAVTPDGDRNLYVGLAPASR